MIDRKIKILVDKPKFYVGANYMEPPNDLVLGGRDIKGRQAEIVVENGAVFLKAFAWHVYVNGQRIEKDSGVQLAHLDRVVFGWNSVFLFKNKDPNAPPNPDKFKGRYIDWYFVKNELQDVDIDNSDDEESGGCCEMF
jgi:hypothetical protein